MRTLKLLVVTCIAACGADDTADDTANTSTFPPPTQSAGTTSDIPTSTGDTPTTAAATSIDPASTSTSSSATGTTAVVGCGACNEPNQQCIDDVCVTGCQGQDPDPCGPAQVCDVVTGACVDPGTACAVAGPSEPCGDNVCAAGTVCDGQGACLAVAPCGLETCTSQGVCWGGACQCERGVTCSDPATDLLNGPFSADLFGLDFADDCTAWGVTISGGQEFVRRLTSAGEYVSFGAIGDYDLGEVRVLRHLTVPQRTVLPDTVITAEVTPTHVEGYGEVAVTYVCCPTCGDCANNPLARGVARLVEEDPNMPLPIVIPAEATQGTGPFGNNALDGGPQGLTWGNDRVLYVGNTSANGQFETADLEAGTVAPVLLFADRTTASAAISPVHLLVAVHPGMLYRLNTVTMESDFVVDLMSGVTSLSHDAFNGDVYASLANLEVVRVRPFTGDVEPFAVMPVIGRIAVSPAGSLWFTPVKYLNNVPLASWPLPTSL